MPPSLTTLRRPLDEFMLAAFLVPIAAQITGLVIYFGIIQSSDVLIIVSFIFYVLVFHCIYFFLRNWSSVNVVRYVDYAYLIYSALGVMINISVYQFQKERDYEQKLARQAQDFIEDHVYRFASLKERVCAQSPKPKVCQTIALFEEAAQEQGIALRQQWEVKTEELIAAFKILEPKEDVVLRSAESDQSPQLYNISKLFLSRLDNLKNRKQALSDWTSYKTFSYYILAAAVALRLTRVTIELRKWFS